jgi:hypothetical protein
MNLPTAFAVWFTTVAVSGHFCNKTFAPAVAAIRGFGFALTKGEIALKAKGGIRKMRKLLMSILLVASFGFAGLVTEAKATTNASLASPQLRIRIGNGQHRRWRNREYRRYGYGRTYMQTRLVRRGWRTYRETYQVRYFPNGQTYTTLVSRIRVS